MATKLIKRLAAVAALAVTAPLLFAGVASGHGYTTNAPSRSYNCKTGAAQNCGPVQWDPHSIEGPKGFPAAGPANGKICAGGLSQFAQLDDPRGGNWPAKQVSSGSFTFTWTLTAPHATTSFRYFITRNGWNPSAPLTRAQLESQPFYTVPFNGARPGFNVSHTGQLPSGKSGRHLILAVWDIADTGNAFYQCADVTF
ncbi:lytic polysaccharide monooxygenase auxiliary activity family 9 protein [Amycolatopsis suaedae]|uniref:Chitin-binding protein n=1 Tax=Amycolatopsis suaedae TaxID=2510978 RepID=A0A4Q7J4Z0_9PSEU|nr:lytic polysaccharide monooxygenase [Amycolatopsis suaedae]RZQ62129.1 chitin-binding protein [Amycolatopsis suaedae]